MNSHSSSRGPVCSTRNRPSKQYATLYDTPNHDPFSWAFHGNAITIAHPDEPYKCRNKVEDSGKHRFYELERESKMRLFHTHSHLFPLYPSLPCEPTKPPAGTLKWEKREDVPVRAERTSNTGATATPQVRRGVEIGESIIQSRTQAITSPATGAGRKCILANGGTPKLPLRTPAKFAGSHYSCRQSFNTTDSRRTYNKFIKHKVSAADAARSMKRIQDLDSEISDIVAEHCTGKL